jgi:hypothetical protein
LFDDIPPSDKNFNLLGNAFLQAQAELSGRLSQLGEQQALEQGKIANASASKSLPCSKS